MPHAGAGLRHPDRAAEVSGTCRLRVSFFGSVITGVPDLTRD